MDEISSGRNSSQMNWFSIFEWVGLAVGLLAIAAVYVFPSIFWAAMILYMMTDGWWADRKRR